MDFDFRIFNTFVYQYSIIVMKPFGLSLLFLLVSMIVCSQNDSLQYINNLYLQSGIGFDHFTEGYSNYNTAAYSGFEYSKLPGISAGLSLDITPANKRVKIIGGLNANVSYQKFFYHEYYYNHFGGTENFGDYKRFSISSNIFLKSRLYLVKNKIHLSAGVFAGIPLFTSYSGNLIRIFPRMVNHSSSPTGYIFIKDSTIYYNSKISEVVKMNPVFPCFLLSAGYTFEIMGKKNEIELTCFRNNLAYSGFGGIRNYMLYINWIIKVR